MEKLQITVNRMMADDGPTPMDLGNVGAYDAKTTQSDSDTSNDMSYEVPSLGRSTRRVKEQAKRDREHG